MGGDCRAPKAQKILQNWKKPLPLHSQMYRGVEQLVARRAHNPEAGGSSPPPATKTNGESNGSPFVFALGEGENRRFEPTHEASAEAACRLCLARRRKSKLLAICLVLPPLLKRRNFQGFSFFRIGGYPPTIFTFLLNPPLAKGDFLGGVS